MAVLLGHAEAPHGVAFEIEFDQHDRLVADDPAIMARVDGHDARRSIRLYAPIRVFDVNLAARQKTGVCVHTEVGAHVTLHVG